MEKKARFDLGKIRNILMENGYTLNSGLNVNFNDVAASCGSTCTGGCKAGCYTCSTGTSKTSLRVTQPTILLSRESMLDDILTITSTPVAQKD